jgi:hypothetical protein
MQPEAIRAFKRTWKPRPSRGGQPGPQLTLVLAPQVERAQGPRVSLTNPLPPPSLAALNAVGRRGFEQTETGVRRKPLLEAPPCSGLDRECDEDVDPEPEILCMYVVPPVPPRARKQDATIEIEDDWLEPLSEGDVLQSGLGQAQQRAAS